MAISDLGPAPYSDNWSLLKAELLCLQVWTLEPSNPVTAPMTPHILMKAINTANCMVVDPMILQSAGRQHYTTLMPVKFYENMGYASDFHAVGKCSRTDCPCVHKSAADLTTMGLTPPTPAITRTTPPTVNNSRPPPLPRVVSPAVSGDEDPQPEHEFDPPIPEEPPRQQGLKPQPIPYIGSNTAITYPMVICEDSDNDSLYN